GRGTRDGGRGTGARRRIPGPLPYTSVATFSEFHPCWTREVHLSWTNDVHLSWTTMSIYPGQRCPSVLDNDVHLSWTNDVHDSRISGKSGYRDAPGPSASMNGVPTPPRRLATPPRSPRYPPSSAAPPDRRGRASP